MDDAFDEEEESDREVRFRLLFYLSPPYLTRS